MAVLEGNTSVIDIVDYVKKNPREIGESKQEYYRKHASTLGYTAKSLKGRFVKKRIWGLIDSEIVIVPKLAVPTDANLEKVEWAESNDNVYAKYEGEKSITNKGAAIKFFKVDLDEFEVVDFQWKSWDVTMKVNVWVNKRTGKRWKENTPFYEEELKLITVDQKRTNYGCTLKLLPIKPLVIDDIIRTKQPKFKSKKAGEFVLGIPCIHFPFHNVILWGKVLQLIRDNRDKFTTLILMGDWLDLRSLSSHEEYIPEGIDLSYEYNSGRQGILDLKDAFGPKKWKSLKKEFVYGNHEERFNRDKKACRKYGSTLPNPHEALRLIEEGFGVQTNWKDAYVTTGVDTDWFHGTYWGNTPAKQTLKKGPTRNHVFTHSHRSSRFSDGGFTAYNVGCLVDIESEAFKYSDRFKRARWENGFPTAYVTEKGETIVDYIKCIGNNFYFGGKKY